MGDNDDQNLVSGMIVTHRSFGSGLVVDRIGDDQVIIDFPRRKGHKMAISMALRSLKIEPFFQGENGSIVKHGQIGLGTIVEKSIDNVLTVKFLDGQQDSFGPLRSKRELELIPAGGLQDYTINDFETLKSFELNSPLKLLALAVMDFGGEARPQNIRDLIAGQKIIESGLTSWWSKVTEMSNNSKSFLKTREGSIKLLVGIENVETDPILNVEDKITKNKTNMTLEEVIENLPKSLSFTSVPNLRKAVNQLISENKFEWLFALNQNAWNESIPATNMILDRLSKNDLPDKWFFVINNLIESIESFLEEENDSTKDGKWILSRIKLIEGAVNKCSLKSSPENVELEKLFIDHLVNLVIKINQDSQSSWVLDSRKSLEGAFTSILNRNLEYVEDFGRSLKRFDDDVAIYVFRSMIERIVAAADESQKSDLMRRLWKFGPEYSSEAIWNYLLAHLTTQEFIRFISVESQKDDGYVESSMSVLADYTLRISEKVDPNLLRDLVKCQLGILMYEYELQPTFYDKATENLIHSIEESQNIFNKRTIFDVVTGVMNSFVHDNDAKNRQLIEEKEKNIDALQANLESAISGTKRAEEVAHTVRSSFRIPELKARSEGEFGVLKELSAYYQELKAGAYRSEGSSNQAATLSQLEMILSKFGVEKISLNDKEDVFDPDIHTPFSRNIQPGAKVKLVCEGFLRAENEESGKSTVLVKVLVEEVNTV